MLNPGRLSFRGRLIRMLPAGRRLLPEGDFRDWSDLEKWAAEIADGLGASGKSAAQPAGDPLPLEEALPRGAQSKGSPEGT